MKIQFLVCVLLFGIASCMPVSSGPSDKSSAEQKRIALTFDDGPRGAGPRFTGDQRAQVLIAALEESSGQPAAFFIKTGNFKREGGRERIQRYAEAGHLIANHTHSHDWLSQTETQDYVDDIAEAERLLQGFDNRRPWFRFPYLDEGRTREKRDAVRVALGEQGLFNGYVTVDNYDWYLERKWKDAVDAQQTVDVDALRNVYVEMLLGAVSFYDALAVNVLGRSPVHVLLLHENDVAALFVDDLVRALQAEGWTIVSPDEAYADPMARIVPRTLMTRQGHVAALAIEAGTDPKTMTHLAIEEGQIDQLLEERNIFGPGEAPKSR